MAFEPTPTFAQEMLSTRVNKTNESKTKEEATFERCNQTPFGLLIPTYLTSEQGILNDSSKEHLNYKIIGCIARYLTVDMIHI